VGVWKRPRMAWIAAGIAIALGAAAVVVFGVERHGRRTMAIVDIDPYPARTDVTGCTRPLVGKPGVQAFRSLILTQVGGGDDGLAVCKRIANASREYSDHADGRAWDWHVRASRAHDRALVDRVLDWLLRTDERGHRNAMARRLGITYIIWNHQYYRVGSDEARWVPYRGTADPHDTHVHFSFSVAGALLRTSWWTQRGPMVWALPTGADLPLVFGRGPLRPLAGDWDGDGRDTAGVYDIAERRFTLRESAPLGASVATVSLAEISTAPLGPFGSIPLAGDWDGDGRDSVGVYDPLTRRFLFLSTTGAPARQRQVFGAAGDLPLVGDWNGDGVDDVGTYNTATRTFALLLPDGTVRTEGFGGVNDTPVIGDWNGDGVDDIGAYRSSRHTFYRAVLTVGGPGSRALSPINYGSGRHLPVIGDWDGDGVDDHGIVSPN
jgi:hypothetical protein